MDASHPAANGTTPPQLSEQSALLAHMEDNAESLVEDLARLLPQVKEDGRTLADIKGWNRGEIEALYEMGHGLFQQEAWRDALTVFVHLAAHDPFDIRFQFAAGMCFQQLDDPLAASVAHSHALMLDAMRADVAFRLGESLADAGQTEPAEQVLKTTLELINENFEQFHHLRGPAQERLAALATASTQE